MTQTTLHYVMLRFVAVATLILGYCASALATPDIEQWQTQHGSQVVFVAAQELPMVDIRITFDAGSARDGDTPGLALLTNGLLAEGTGELDADAIAERFEDIGARFGNTVNRDSASVSLRSLSDPQWLKPALDTFTRVAGQPSFPANALERERQRALIALQGEKQSPQSLIDKAFYAQVYNGHDYASPVSGTEQSLSAIGRTDIVKFHQRYYGAGNATIAIVGDLDRKAAEALADALSAQLPKGDKAAPIAAFDKAHKGQRVHIEHPSTQTHIMVGLPSLKRGDPDHFALYVGNYVLGGGGFGSRIMKEIREKRGLAYSAYSYFAPMRVQGPFVMGLQTTNTQSDEALQVLAETLAQFVEQGPSDEELASAKRDIINGFPLSIASNDSTLDYISMIGFYGLPLDYLDRFTQNIDSVTREQIRDAFNRHVKPERLVTVTVGQGENG